ncbi:MAG: sugar ABC transporter permease [Treponema sp.]|nr:sugar ABC transporter permease [Treponema sp.]
MRTKPDKPRISKAHFRRDLNITLQAYSMYLPNLILFVVLGLYPIAWSIRYVFYHYTGNPILKPVFVGLDNFVRVFVRDKTYWMTVGNTFIYAGGKILLTLPFAFAAAFILNRPNRVNKVFQSLIFMPTITSSAVMAMIFYLLFNLYNGEINRYLMAWGIVDEPISWLNKYAMGTVIIVAAWGAIGNYMVYFLSALQMVPRELLESGVIDGANRWQSLIHITLPMMTPILKIILMFIISSAFGDFGSIMVLTAGGPINKTMVMTLYAYKYLFPITVEGGSVATEIGYGAALSVVNGLIAGVMTGIYLWFGWRMDRIFDK